MDRIRENIKKNNLNSGEDIIRFFSNDPYYFKVDYNNNTPFYSVTYTDESLSNNNVDDMAHDYYKIKGLFLSKDNHSIISYAFPKIFELFYFSNNFNPNLISIDWNNCHISEAIDSCLIKLYYYENEWFIGTNRCVDANRSRWMNQISFKNLFLEASLSQIDYTKLNVNYCYSFLLCHPTIRNVKRHEFPTIYHVLTRDTSNLEIVDHDIGIQKPQTYDFSSLDQCINLISNMEWFQRGLIIYDKTNKRFYELPNPKFLHVKSIRGESSCLLMRYLEIKNLPDIIDQFKLYFNEYSYLIDYTENLINIHAKQIYLQYLNKFVQKIPVQIIKNYKKIIFDTHNRYKTTNEKTNPKIIKSIMNKYTPKCLYYILKANSNFM